MRTGVTIATAWLTATFVAVVIASAAVGNVRTQVTDGPTALGPPTTIEADTVAPTTMPVDEAPHLSIESDTHPDTDADADTDTDADTDVTEPASPSTTTTVVTETTTTQPHSDESHSDESPVTSTTQPPPPTTTTTIAGYTKTYNVTVDDVTAGTVRIAISGESVSFSGATVAPGWTFKLEEEGPDKVEVKFEAIEDDDIQMEFKADFDDGELDIEISLDD